MTTSLVRPTSWEIGNQRADQYTITAVGGNPAGDNNDSTYFDIPHRIPNSGTHPYVSFGWDGVNIPSNHNITALSIFFRKSSPNLDFCYLRYQYQPFAMVPNWNDNSYWQTTQSSGVQTPADFRWDLTIGAQNVTNFGSGARIAVSTYDLSGYQGRMNRLHEIWAEIVHAPAPPNDRYADRIVIPSTQLVEFTGTLEGASYDPTEDWGGSGSVWYQWTCPPDWPDRTAMTLTLGRDDSSPTPQYGAFMLSMRGGSPGNWDSNFPTLYTYEGANDSSLNFRPTPGKTYTIQVAANGLNRRPGDFKVSWAPAGLVPTNDDFADAITITKGQAVSADLSKATPDPGFDSAGTNSIWYKYVSDGTPFSYSVAGGGTIGDEDVFMEVDVYRTSTPNDIDSLSWVSNVYTPDNLSKIVWKPRPGETYFFELYSNGIAKNLTSLNIGTLSFTDAPPLPPPPPNDRIDDAIELDLYMTGTVPFDLSSATKSPEDNALEQCGWDPEPQWRTAWYKFTAPPEGVEDGYVEFEAYFHEDQYTDWDYDQTLMLAAFRGPKNNLECQYSWGNYDQGYAYSDIEPNETIYIMVAELDGEQGFFKGGLRISWPQFGMGTVKTDEGYSTACNCPDPKDWSVTEPKTYQLGNGTGSTTKWVYPSGSRLNRYTRYNWSPYPGHPAVNPYSSVSAIEGPVSYGTSIFETTADPAGDDNYAFIVNWDLYGNVPRIGWIGWPKGLEVQGRVNKVTFKAKMKGYVTVFIEPFYVSRPEQSSPFRGIGVEFESPGEYTWQEADADLSHLSDREREAISEGISNNTSTSTLAVLGFLNYRGFNEGDPAKLAGYVAALEVTIHTDKGEAVSGRLKLNAGTEEEPIWWTQRCCHDTTWGYGRPLKIKAGDEDWRTYTCMIRDPGPWVQPPDIEITWVARTGMHYQSQYPSNTGIDLNQFAKNMGSYLGGQLTIWRAPGGPIVPDSSDAIQCSWKYARIFNVNSYWPWNDTYGCLSCSYGGGTPLCWEGWEPGRMGGAGASYSDWPIGYAILHEPAQFGAGFGADVETRAYGQAFCIAISAAERASGIAHPSGLTQPGPPGSNMYIWEENRATLLDLWVAPTEPVGNASNVTAEWYINRTYTKAQRDALGWGYSPDDGWMGSMSGPNDFIGSMQHITTYSGGQSPWWRVPDDLIAQARQIEDPDNSSTSGGSSFRPGLTLVGIPTALLNINYPPEMTPPISESNEGFFYRPNSTIAVKARFRPSRYRWGYDT